MSRFITRLIIIFLIALGIWFWINLATGNNVEEQTFVVSSGQGVNQISDNLRQANLIRNKLVFESWIWVKRAESQVVAGTYFFPADLSTKNLVNLLLAGPQGAVGSITIIEGWDRNWPKFKEVLMSKDFSHQEFLAATAHKTDWQADYPFLQDAPSYASLEGYIYPDTYNIDSSTTVNDLIIKALNNFDRKLTNQLRQDIQAQGKTIFEVVTLASIVEREVTNRGDDRQMIADIFLKRLAIGMGLQSDATINFITGKGLARPTAEDLQVNSPYNTYQHAGLPPGPISNPSLSSIEAVVYPQSNPYYYFLTTEDGTIIYATTHDQHVDNKAKYLN